MAQEVILWEYLMFDQKWCSLSLTEDHEEPELPFLYNTTHDIKSVWWIGVWILLFFKPSNQSKMIKNSDKCQTEVGQLFPGTSNNQERLAYFYQGRFRGAIKNLHQENVLFTFLYFLYFSQVKKVQKPESTEYLPQEILFTLFHTFCTLISAFWE